MIVETKLLPRPCDSLRANPASAAGASEVLGLAADGGSFMVKIESDGPPRLSVQLNQGTAEKLMTQMRPTVSSRKLVRLRHFLEGRGQL